MIEHFYESIPGWFNFQDIYREQVERAQDGAVFVEVGSWLGRSTAFMAVEIANSGKQISFYAIDTWQGSPAPQYQKVIRELGGSAYGAFRENMRRGGVEQYVTPIIGHSANTAVMCGHRVDFVFIDAAHDYHSVRQDVAAWLPMVDAERGGMIAGHDTNCPGLMNAVKSVIPADRIAYSGTSWMHRATVMPPHEEAVRQIARRWNVRVRPTVAKAVGCLDSEMESMALQDYAYRSELVGARWQSLLTVSDERDGELYRAKWGGPPGEETFTIPYNLNTTDW